MRFHTLKPYFQIQDKVTTVLPPPYLSTFVESIVYSPYLLKYFPALIKMTHLNITDGTLSPRTDE